MKMLSRIRDLILPQQKSYPYLPESFYQSYFVTTAGKPVWTPREYKKFADEAYIKNVIAHRSIAMIAQGAASVPFRLFFVEAGQRQEIHDHPALRLLARPNPCDSGKEFLESIYAYRLISGNAFVQAIIPEDSLPMELYALRPDRVAVLAGKDGMPAAYEHTVGEKTQRFPVDRITGRSNILHLANFHPLSDWIGLSPIEAAAYSIDQHNQAGQWNQAMLQNGARPSGALVVKTNNDGSGGTLAEEQYTRIKQQMEEQFSGPRNAGRPLLLEGGLDWREMSLSPKDMDFINAKHSSARDIALAFGVPPQLLGIPGDNTYSNLAEARLALWEQTILPLVDHLTSAFNNWLLPRYNNSLVLESNADEVSALSPRRESTWQRIQNSTYMTLNEKRQAMGLPPVEGGDRF